jgi:hypothetical protein
MPGDPVRVGPTVLPSTPDGDGSVTDPLEATISGPAAP